MDHPTAICYQDFYSLWLDLCLSGSICLLGAQSWPSSSSCQQNFPEMRWIGARFVLTGETVDRPLQFLLAALQLGHPHCQRHRPAAPGRQQQRRGRHRCADCESSPGIHTRHHDCEFRQHQSAELGEECAQAAHGGADQPTVRPDLRACEGIAVQQAAEARVRERQERHQQHDGGHLRASAAAKAVHKRFLRAASAHLRIDNHIFELSRENSPPAQDKNLIFDVGSFPFANGVNITFI